MKVGDDIIPFDERKIVEDFFKDKEKDNIKLYIKILRIEKEII